MGIYRKKVAPFTCKHIYFSSVTEFNSYNSKSGSETEIRDLTEINKNGIDTVVVRDLITFYSMSKYGDIKIQKHKCLSRYNSSRSQFLISFINQRVSDLCCYEYAGMTNYIFRKHGFNTKLLFLTPHALNIAFKQNDTFIVD